MTSLALPWTTYVPTAGVRVPLQYFLLGGAGGSTPSVDGRGGSSSLGKPRRFVRQLKRGTRRLAAAGDGAVGRRGLPRLAAARGGGQSGVAVKLRRSVDGRGRDGRQPSAAAPPIPALPAMATLKNCPTPAARGRRQEDAAASIATTGMGGVVTPAVGPNGAAGCAAACHCCLRPSAARRAAAASAAVGLVGPALVPSAAACALDDGHQRDRTRPTPPPPSDAGTACPDQRLPSQRPPTSQHPVAASAGAPGGADHLTARRGQ